MPGHVLLQFSALKVEGVNLSGQPTSETSSGLLWTYGHVEGRVGGLGRTGCVLRGDVLAGRVIPGTTGCVMRGDVLAGRVVPVWTGCVLRRRCTAGRDRLDGVFSEIYDDSVLA